MGPDLPSRFWGGIFGVAVGDALGVPVEFCRRSALDEHPVRHMRGFGTHYQPPGTWSDDTSMTLCLLEGLLDGLSWNDIGALLERWLLEKHWTPHGVVFDHGRTTRDAILAYAHHSDRRDAGLREEWDNGNGSLVRTLPVALLCGEAGSAQLAEAAHSASRLTHAHPRSQMACGICTDLARRLLDSLPPDEAWDATRTWARCYYLDKFPGETTLFSRILDRIAADYRKEPRGAVPSSGYVLDTLHAALWAFFSTNSFDACCLAAVNLGDDADSIGAVAGGLAGIAYGYESIPRQWLEQIVRRDDIADLVERACVAIADDPVSCPAELPACAPPQGGRAG